MPVMEKKEAKKDRVKGGFHAAPGIDKECPDRDTQTQQVGDYGAMNDRKGGIKGRRGTKDGGGRPLEGPSVPIRASGGKVAWSCQSCIHRGWYAVDSQKVAEKRRLEKFLPCT